MDSERPKKGFLSIGVKLALATVAVLLAVSMLLYNQLVSREREGLRSAKRTAASMVADLLAASLAAPLDFRDREAADTELGHLASNRDVLFAAAFDAPDAPPLAASGHREGGSNEMSMPSFEPATTTFGDHIDLVRPVIDAGGRQVGGAFVQFSLAAENAAFNEGRTRLFLMSTALAVGTALVLIFLTRRQVVAPLALLADAARRLERGERTARVVISSNDELGELSRGFNRMIVAIADNESRLAEATRSLRELFDHMSQAIVVFGEGGKISGPHSLQAVAIFREARLEERTILELLYPGPSAKTVEAQAFAQWLEIAFSAPMDAWDELVGLAPHEVTIRPGAPDETWLELEFRPVLEGESLGKVMLLATDRSETRRLARAVRSGQEEHDRQIAAMRRLVAGGGHVFVAFLDGARSRIGRCELMIEKAAGMLLSTQIDEFFRHVHTIKGEARAFDLGDLARESSELEVVLHNLRDRARGDGVVMPPDVRDDLRERLARARGAIDKGGAMFVEASPIGRVALDQITVRRSDVLRLREVVTTRGDEIDRLVGRLVSRPFGESVAPLVGAVPEWAERDGKRARLIVEGRETPVPAALTPVLGGALAHLVRNALAHGIELPHERKSAGKDERGTIVVRCEEAVRGVRVVVQDDGRGLDLQAIGARAADAGLSMSAADLEQLIFDAGFSTAEVADDNAGYGVGLAAVRAELAEVGYSVSVASTPGAGARFTLSMRDEQPALSS